MARAKALRGLRSICLTGEAFVAWYRVWGQLGLVPIAEGPTPDACRRAVEESFRDLSGPLLILRRTLTPEDADKQAYRDPRRRMAAP